MSKSTRRQLTDAERRRAATFRRAWDAKKAAERLSQAVAGEALNMSPSAFGQYINGKVPIGLEAALALCAYLDVSHEDAGVRNDIAKTGYPPPSPPPNIGDAFAVADFQAFVEAMPIEGQLKLMEVFFDKMTLEERVEVARLALGARS